MDIVEHKIRQLLEKADFLKTKLARNSLRSSLQGSTFHYQFLADGLTNENYKITIIDNNLTEQASQKVYLLKIYSDQSKQLSLVRSDEINIISSISSLDLSPSIVFHCLEGDSQQQNFSLYQWLDGEVFTKKRLGHEQNICHLAKKLQQLHSFPYEQLTNRQFSQQKLPVLNFSQRILSYRSVIMKSHGRLDITDKKHFDRAMDIVNKHRSIKPCLCHNDLVAANIIELNNLNKPSDKNNHRSKMMFIDWEYAAVTDPLFELAVIIRGNDFSLKQQQLFLKTYFGESFEKKLEAINQWNWLYDYMSKLWQLITVNPKL